MLYKCNRLLFRGFVHYENPIDGNVVGIDFLYTYIQYMMHINQTQYNAKHVIKICMY